MLMVQANSQTQMKPNKVKGPPPVPPRPNQSLVAEALAKTRRAVAESKAKNNSKERQKLTTRSKTLDRTVTAPSATPKQNGLARVKSFIKDVISDRSSSSDEKKSSGQNSRRSSSDSSSVTPSSAIKRSNESLNSKTVKTCRQILVRSFSTSNKLEQDNSKSKVTKSSSFAEKNVPIRKAPPPPLSPKPKLKKPLQPLQLVRKNSLDKKRLSSRLTPDTSPYSSPVDAKKPACPLNDAPYATVEEVQALDERLQNTPTVENNNNDCNTEKDTNTAKRDINSNNSSLERKTSRVTEMLISEILAGRNNNIESEENTVIDKGKEEIPTNGLDEQMPKDMNNHEMLIYELQTMGSLSSVPETFNNKSEIENNERSESETSEQNYAVSSESGGHTDDSELAYAYILDDDDLKSRLRKQFKAISSMSLHGLPPLPKSLSGFAEPLEPEVRDPAAPVNPSSDFEGQLAYLKREMASLRQLDLSLLSELWSLSEAMSAWRRQLERAPRRPAPPPPPSVPLRT